MVRLVVGSVQPLLDMAAKLGATPAAAERAAYRTLNAVAARVQTDAIRSIVSQINLPTGYVRGVFSVHKAGPGVLKAEVRASMAPVGLERFAAKQVTKKNTLKRPGKGDSLRGIPAGRKAAGVSVKVAKSGPRKTMPGAFLMPMRAGLVSGGNGLGVFTRRGPGKKGIKHEYGPSPDQLFRRYASTSQAQIGQWIAAAFSSQLKYEMTGSRK
jgi:hypothetical protein